MKQKYYWAIYDKDNKSLFSGINYPYLLSTREKARKVKSYLIPEVRWKIIKVKIAEAKNEKTRNPF